MTPRHLEFDIAGLPMTLNELQRSHWRKTREHGRKWKALVHREVFLRWKGVPAERVRLTLTRFSSVEPDRDNNTASFKPVIDGLVKSGVLADDRPDNILDSQYRWARAAPSKGFIRVLIEEILETETTGEKA